MASHARCRGPVRVVPGDPGRCAGRTLRQIAEALDRERFVHEERARVAEVRQAVAEGEAP
ncbi:hypothetical protein [Streptomyces sp. NPDC048411]|uniref:hypothetical protein n=1 Tax=Streptomyces sp. NPDC048411 TaxID=3157206 RepID=UPI003453C71A